MKHRERLLLSKSLSDKMLKTHRCEVILSGLYGSTARSEDTAWSDLDMLFIVDEESKIEGKDFLYKNIVVGYRVLKVKELEKILTCPTKDWSFWMGVFQALKVIYGEQKMVKNWIEKGLAVPDEKFRTLLEKVLPSLVFESYSRILSCKIRNKPMDLNVSIVEVILEMNKALCLLNHRWVTHDYYQGIIDTFDFSKLPRRYKKIAPKLWNCHDMDKAVVLAKELVDDYKKLLSENGFIL